MYSSFLSALLLAAVATEGAAVSTETSGAASKYHWLFQSFDRNSNSVIDPSEFERLPPPMRDWLLKKEVNLRRPISRNSFLRFAPQMMDAMRSKKTARSSFQYPHSPFLEEETDRSSRLPAKYRRRDKDGDGQIGFYEWNWRDSAEFSTLDLNDDGFLTPRELGAPSPKFVRKSRKTTDSPRKVFFDAARSVFRKADRSRDGQLSSREWSRIQPTKQFTREPGLRPQFPMKFPQFSDYYRNWSVKRGM